MVNQSSDPTIVQCTFTANSAIRGGGLYNENSRPRVLRCVFIGNDVEQSGAGMLNDRNSHPDVNECVFVGNKAETGAGVADENGSSASITYCTFSRNHATQYGGAVQDTNECITTLQNCLLVGNMADQQGGALSLIKECQAFVYQCTFADNLAAIAGSAVSSRSIDGPSKLDFMNCIFWNQRSEFVNEDSSVIIITYSDIHGGWPGKGNIDLDPKFTDYQMQAGDSNESNIWFQGDYHLLPSSPCIDAGSPEYAPQPDETDIDGDPRIVGDQIDMGVDEFVPAR